jgi:mannan endo-1,4-beta-mannosidase
VTGKFLYSPAGEKIILRGENKMNVVTDPTGEAFLPEIYRTGSNAVRMMWMRSGCGSDKLDI